MKGKFQLFSYPKDTLIHFFSSLTPSFKIDVLFKKRIFIFLRDCKNSEKSIFMNYYNLSGIELIMEYFLREAPLPHEIG